MTNKGSALMSVDLDVTIASDEGVDTVAMAAVVVLDVIPIVESRNVDVDLDDLISAIISRALNFIVVSAVVVVDVFRVVEVTVVEEVGAGTRGLRAGALAT